MLLPESQRTLNFIETVKMGYSLRKNPFESLQALSDSQVDYCELSLGPKHAVLIGNADTARYILKLPYDTVRKNGRDIRIFREIIGDNLFSVEGGDEWQERRTASQPAFHSEMMNSYGATIIDKTQEHLARIPEHAPVDITSIVNHLTADIASTLLFGKELSPQEAQELQTAVNDIVFGYSDILKNSGILYKFGFPANAIAQAKRGKEHLDHLATNLQTGEHSAYNLLHMLREHAPPESVHSELVNYYIVAYETTANALLWTLDELSRHPEWVERIREELHDKAHTWDELKSLPVTEAVFKEGLRLYPSIWLFNRKAIKPIPLPNGRTLAAGTSIGISPYLIHRNSKHWDNPNTFDPNRFLTPQPPRVGTFIPFGLGNRACIGAPLALKEAPIILGMLLSRYHLRLHTPMKVSTAGVMKPRSPVLSTFERRP